MTKKGATGNDPVTCMLITHAALPLSYAPRSRGQGIEPRTSSGHYSDALYQLS